MNYRQNEIINLLALQQHPLSSSYIANQLGISKNSVKNIISQINSESGARLIDSSNKGYQLTLTGINHYSNSKQKQIPQTYLERAFFIIKHIALSKNEPDVYDLADKMFVSYSTLKNTLQRMNGTFERFRVKFVCKKDIVKIQGTEEDLRKLTVYAISEETNWQFVELEPLKKNVWRIAGTDNY